MKVTKIAIGYYKIKEGVNVYYVSYEDIQRVWIMEVEIDNSLIGMANSLDYVASTTTLKNCKLIVEQLNK